MSLEAMLMMWAIFGLIIGLLAERKNRNFWAWAIIGGAIWVPALIVLSFKSILCPKCKNPITNQEWKERKCPRCNWTG